MIRILLPALIFLFAVNTVRGQLFPVSDYYVNNPLFINPAFAGSSDALDVTALYRNSLSGFEGSPQTFSLSLHSPFRNEKIGLGFYLMNDKMGISSENIFAGNYAFRVPLHYGRISFGMAVGIIFQKTAWDHLNATDPGDEAIAGNTSTGILPDFSFGASYKTDRYFLGFAVPLFLTHVYHPGSDRYHIRNDFNKYNYFFNAGYGFHVSPTIEFMPSVLLRYQKSNGVQIDINSDFLVLDRFIFGLSYRSMNMCGVSLQGKISDQLKIGYAYNFFAGDYMKGNYQSHEFLLSYLFIYNVNAQKPGDF